MTKFIITWDIGYGPQAQVIDAENEAAAGEAAYEAAREDFENSAEYGVLPYSKEEAESLGAEE